MGSQSRVGLPSASKFPVTRLTRPELIARFDQIWRDYAARETRDQRIAEHTSGRDRFLETLNHYARAARPPRIAEIGCGSAIDLCLLRRRVPEIFAVGLDISRTGIMVARGTADHLQIPLGLCQGDTYALPFRTASLGVVFNQGVLEHFPDPYPVLAEQVRVLSEGGVLIISVPQAFTGYTIHKHRAIRADTWPWGWEDQYSSRRLRRLGKRLGLRVERVFGYQYWLSWGEPAWILRDLVRKVERRAPDRLQHLISPISAFYDRGWNWLEEHFGHCFLQNVVAVFRVARKSE